jgi:hypothetical protein
LSRERPISDVYTFVLLASLKDGEYRRFKVVMGRKRRRDYGEKTLEYIDVIVDLMLSFTG